MVSLAPPPLAGDTVTPLRFSTRALSTADQFAAWRDFTAPAVDLSLVSAPHEGFVAEQDVWDLGSLALTVATMPGAGFVRAWRHWRKAPVDHWCLVLCPATTHSPAVFGIRSLDTPFEGAGADEKVISLFIPRDLFPHLAASLDAAPGLLPLEGLPGMLADHLVSLERHLPRTPKEGLSQLAGATRALVAAALAPHPDATEAAGEVIANTLRARARRIIRQHVAAPDLTPEWLCRTLGVSRSRLYRLFEEMGGVSRYIQRQRLLAALTLLGDPSEPRTIAQIAERFGFPDHSGFSRAFKAEFGTSPSAARAAGQMLPPAAPASTTAATDGMRHLADVLHRLQP